MKKNLMVISTIFISCTSIPLMEEPIERCSIFLEKQKCRCHKYEISPDKIGRIGESKDYDITYCDKSVVLRPENSWTPLRAWFEELMIFHHQNERR